jgi:hypothetical protein
MRSVINISITLPSVHPEALKRTLANLRAVTEGSYEVIVVSPFEPPGLDEVVWLPEDKACGPNIAHGFAFTLAQGEYILGWVDDHLLVEGWDTAAILNLRIAEAVDRPAMIGLRHRIENHVGTVFGHYYPYFPFARCSAMRNIGWLGVGQYRRGFADCDLGLRVWDKGGFCTWGRRCVLRCDDDVKVLPDGEAGYEPEDLEKFLKRWGHKFPNWPTNMVRGFNIDIIPEQLSAVKIGGTVRFASPLEMSG